MDKAPRKKLLRKPIKALVKSEKKAPVPKLPSKRHDWDAVRRFFVERMDNVTLADTANTFGIYPDLVRHRSSSERWVEQRSQFQAKAAIDMAKQRLRRLVKEGEAFDDQALQAAKLGMGLIAGRLAQVSQLFAAQQATYASAVQRLRAGLPVSKEELYGAFYAKDMTELARSLELFQKVGKLAVGIDVTSLKPQDLIDQHDKAAEEDEDVSITDELRKPDIDRLAALMETMERMGAATILAPDVDEEDEVDVSGVPGDAPLTPASDNSGEHAPDQTPEQQPTA